MNQIAWIIFIGFTLALALVILPSVAAQITNDNNKNESQKINSQNTNDTRAVVNLKNHTISLIDTKTNETISVKNFAVKNGNNTANKTIGIPNISGNMGNKIANELKSTKNATDNAGNSTEITNLTEKFRALGNQ